MAYFPMFIDLTGVHCLVVGGGEVAFRKVLVLQKFGAIITVLAKDICKGIWDNAQMTENIEIVQKDWCINDEKQTFLRKFRLVVAATDKDEVNHDIAVKCREKNIMVNVVDKREECDFIFPSFVMEGDLVGAFSSGGKSPVVTQYLKECTGEYLTPFLGELTDYLGSVRDIVKDRVCAEKERKKVYQRLLQIGLEEQCVPREEVLEEILEEAVSDRS